MPNSTPTPSHTIKDSPSLRSALRLYVRKILAPIKIKSALPPPQTQNPPPRPQNEEFYGHGGFPAERRHFPGVCKIGATISGPRIADTNFTDTRMFLNMDFVRKEPEIAKPRV